MVRAKVASTARGVQGALGEAQCVWWRIESFLRRPSTEHCDSYRAVKNPGRFSYLVIQISNEVEAPGRERPVAGDRLLSPVRATLRWSLP